MDKDMESIDLAVPIYLNQKVVFDLLAMLEDGFSQLNVIKTSASESESRKADVAGTIGASNVFALLGISLRAGLSGQRGSQGQTEETAEKVHTPASLFSKLRLLLHEKSLVTELINPDDIEQLASGSFVEFRAVLRKNPLVDYIEGITQLMEVAQLFSGGTDSPSGNTPSSGSRKRQSGKQQESEDQRIMRELNAMLGALTESESLEIVGDLLDIPSARAVLSTNVDYFSDRNASEIIDGDFWVLGKVVRVIGEDSDDSVNLLRKTKFGRLKSELFDQLGEAFTSNNEFVDFPAFSTEIGGPAIQVVPIAIFT